MVSAIFLEYCSFFYDQANANAREGRVMIFNLVEVAQEYLSEVTPVLASRCGVCISIMHVMGYN